MLVGVVGQPDSALRHILCRQQMRVDNVVDHIVADFAEEDEVGEERHPLGIFPPGDA